MNQEAHLASRNFGAPVLALCGFSGSGKTTLIEAAIPRLIASGLAIAVVKHDAHGLSLDHRGKDSDRFFRAGATVALRGPAEQAVRRSDSASHALETTLSDIARDHDLILVEGHKRVNLPKLWLADEACAAPPSEVTQVLKTLPRNSDRLDRFLTFLQDWLPRAWAARPVRAGLLVGACNGIRNQPPERTLVELAARALINGLNETSHQKVDCLAIIGSGSESVALMNTTRLAEVPEFHGPIAGLLAAHRWAPHATWLWATCDRASIRQSDVRSLLDHRKPGTWTVMINRLGEHPFPAFALFEPQALEVLERSALQRGPQNVQIAELDDHPRTVVVSRATREQPTSRATERFEATDGNSS